MSLQACGFPSGQAGGFLVISNLALAVHVGLDLSEQSGREPSVQLVAPLLTSVSVLVARPVLPSTTVLSIFLVDVGLDPSVHFSGLNSVVEHYAVVPSVHFGGFPAGVLLSTQ